MVQVFFFIDPEFGTDPNMKGINNLILSYTFFKVEEAQEVAQPAWPIQTTGENFMPFAKVAQTAPWLGVKNIFDWDLQQPQIVQGSILHSFSPNERL